MGKLHYNYILSNTNSNILYIIRIIAAQIVVVGHLFSFYQVTIFKDQQYFPYIQSLAVLVFFLLSGFLTDMSLHRKGVEYSFQNYLKDHIVRIFSFLIPSLFFVFFIDKLNLYLNPGSYTHSATFDVITFIKNIFMLPYKYVPFGSARPLWTLYIEWWLYIGYGYYFLVCKRKHQKNSLNIAYIIILVLIFYFSLKGQNNITIAAFFAGVLINRIYKNIKFCNAWIVLFTFLIFILASMYLKDAYLFVVMFLMALLLLEILVIGDNKQSNVNGKIRKCLVFISGCTYPLYLIHYSIVELILNSKFFEYDLIKMTVSYVLSNILSILFYIIFKPSKNVRDKKLTVGGQVK